jgi:GT2 family glycosyltransferase
MNIDYEGLLGVAKFSPELLNAQSAWLGHLPFASWITNEVSPKILVELGTHYGHSYFSFCQAVVNADISSKCYAVDTWQGDEHAGEYGDEVFAKVDAHNKANYSEFSRLLRMQFNEAVTYFADESVDLLHIDGLHTYEAVRHDFETWLPKLARGAVVIFHDTNVRERGFGVWRFWEELQERFPNNLEFVHSHGLGVLQLNNAFDHQQLRWLQPDFAEKQRLKSYFAALGARQIERYELGELRQRVSHFSPPGLEWDEKTANIGSTLAQQKEQIADLDQIVALRAVEFAGQVANLKQNLAQREMEISSLNEALTSRDRSIDLLRSSTSWRLTKPVRWCGSQVLKIRLVLRALSLAYANTRQTKNFLAKVMEVYKKEGFEGLRYRIKLLLDRNSSQYSFNNISASSIGRKALRLRTAGPIPHEEAVDVVVCVHNALDDVRRCLESVLSNTYPPYRLIIVDDGSNLETQEYLEQLITGQPALLIRNDTATGYTKAANSGMRASNADLVVLLNSDTIVSANWLDRLVECANSAQEIGLVGPLSNTASWQSVPNIMNSSGDWAENSLPEGWNASDYAMAVASISSKIYPRVGFVNGFCILIKRKLIEEIGLFDEETFGTGYGEENDYCLRATEKNWQLAIADDCYIYHAQSKSYSHQRRADLVKLANKSLTLKHGQEKIDRNLFMTQQHPALDYVRNRLVDVETLFALKAASTRRFEGKRVLFLLPAGTSGGGGNIVLLEAAHMRKLGVDVWIANLETHRHLFEACHSDNEVPVLYFDSPDALKEVASDFDAVIATLYLTVFWMVPLEKLERRPRLGYYIQDFEPDFFDINSTARQAAIESYKIISDINLFTKTRWNQRQLEEKIGVSADIVGPSVDIDGFHPADIIRPDGDVVRILAMVRFSTPRRSPAMTMKVLKRVSAYFGPRVNVRTFGSISYDTDILGKSNDFQHVNLGEIDSHSVAVALSQTDIFIDCSHFQAMGLTAMEAMASGVAVIGPITGGLREVITSGRNGILVDTNNEDQIVAAIIGLVEDDGLRRQMQRNALEVVRHSPTYSSIKILECLFPSPELTVGELNKHSKVAEHA